MFFDIKMQVPPVLDPKFIPATLFNRAYEELALQHPEKRIVVIALRRPNGCCAVRKTVILPDVALYQALNTKYVERIVKFMLWQSGGNELIIAGAPELVDELKKIYSSNGTRAFDCEMMGKRIYLGKFSIQAVSLSEAPQIEEIQVQLGGHTNGGRVGFDLGGSDRKCAAIQDGEVVYTEEIKWSPYFKSDPAYHRAGIIDSIDRAAKHLKRLDAIGGSAAGVYVNNQPRLASLFRGISEADFERSIRPLFDELKDKYKVPFVVANDGEVTALAGAMSMSSNSVLGLSMGTSQAVGYVNNQGNITDWLNELAFAPIDYRDDAPADEWSGDIGCGVQYFSQQAVGRLAKIANIDLPDNMPLPEKLEKVQQLMESGDERAIKIYETIGSYLGYSIAHYATFYEIKKLLLLGRVSSGRGGDIIIATAQKVLTLEFPELSQIEIRVPDEKFKRHGQAVIAASLPALK